MPKARRTNSNSRKTTKRPIDKKIVLIRFVNTGPANRYIGIQPAYVSSASIGGGVNFPGTVTGIRWSLSPFCNSATNVSTHISCALIKVREGLNPGALSITGAGGQPMYQPEQDVIVCWDIVVPVNNSGNVIEGSTKTMRKLMAGDQICFVYCSDVADGNNGLVGFIEFFYKT